MYDFKACSRQLLTWNSTLHRFFSCSLQNHLKADASAAATMADVERTDANTPPTASSTDRKEPTSGRRNSDRQRSRSPRRDRDEPRDRPRRKDAGFKWKEKRRDDDDRRETGLNRGYKDHYRPRSRSPRRDSDSVSKASKDVEKKDKPKKEKKPVVTGPSEQPIRVFVNDRLGTKKEIPCYPSDSVKDFKAIVAMMIGRRPHEILLKRQGERPFKDQLTLQDYGVSNNVQLDLEVDTGD